VTFYPKTEVNMPRNRKNGLKEVCIVALPETAASTLYGIVDVLSSTGSIWCALTGEGDIQSLFETKIVSLNDQPFTCGNAIPVNPVCAFQDIEKTDIVIVPEMWLGPDELVGERYPEILVWLKKMYAQGAAIYATCSGVVMLAETGLLDGGEVTTHWGYAPLFNKQFPKVKLNPDRILAFCGIGQRIVTSGGGTSWNDLVLYLIARYSSPEEAQRIAKVFLLNWHEDGQLPFVGMIRNLQHADAVVKRCQTWLEENHMTQNPVSKVVEFSQIPERSLKRRFKSATGSSLMDYIQDLKIERAKHLLERSDMTIESIAPEVGYEDIAFFRRIFKRKTGLPPARYRKMFKPFLENLEQAHQKA